MAITYNWLVEQMDCYPTYDTQTDVVFTIHWRVNATDDKYNVTSYGTQGVTYIPGSPYTPYAQLTQAQVVGWTQNAMGPTQVASIEASLATQISNLANPPVVTPALPWATT